MLEGEGEGPCGWIRVGVRLHVPLRDTPLRIIEVRTPHITWDPIVVPPPPPLSSQPQQKQLPQGAGLASVISNGRGVPPPAPSVPAVGRGDSGATPTNPSPASAEVTAATATVSSVSAIPPSLAASVAVTAEAVLGNVSSSTTVSADVIMRRVSDVTLYVSLAALAEEFERCEAALLVSTAAASATGAVQPRLGDGDGGGDVSNYIAAPTPSPHNSDAAVSLSLAATSASDPLYLSARIAALNARKTELEEAAGEGALSPEGLLTAMKGALTRDMMLVRLLQQRAAATAQSSFLSSAPAAISASAGVGTGRGAVGGVVAPVSATGDVSAPRTAADGLLGGLNSTAAMSDFKAAAAFVLRRAKTT